MIDQADLPKRIGDLSLVWHPTERERIEIAGMLRERNAMLDMPPSDAVAALVGDLRRGQRWQIHGGLATVETALEASRVRQQAADLLERFDRLTVALVRRVARSARSEEAEARK
ncbi:hypothetical protein ABIF65_006006 [Bradyrhizobium japonicum]|jgi:hypothetical protein|uniref:Uncharacterized protein n=1 Tax=Bradyrhizobium barranii subsp. barranii TaxID=2823807 RepID=A0A7Z0TRF8_9BRAD|nr:MULTISPECIES: hypothetical protein [Bradyrhizobium]MBR0884804.1 hypothetical protein [Bradyrhizobium liaoningense]MBR1004991.1 hypothetical protein [Bradyrhizobium liaoningense]MBR1068327.1 hypothetical protein [Bradyrhizobium liaoningense]MCP1744343.1 hypothetical protein [Bradyrhizobium japonicum]MCP1782624.1 hypothetical protein [Bradyrhizobium japonicum]